MASSVNEPMMLPPTVMSVGVPCGNVSWLPSPSMSMVAAVIVNGSLSGSLSMPFAVMTLVLSVVFSSVVSTSSIATGARCSARIAIVKVGVKRLVPGRIAIGVRQIRRSGRKWSSDAFRDIEAVVDHAVEREFENVHQAIIVGVGRIDCGNCDAKSVFAGIVGPSLSLSVSRQSPARRCRCQPASALTYEIRVEGLVIGVVEAVVVAIGKAGTDGTGRRDVTNRPLGFDVVQNAIVVAVDIVAIRDAVRRRCPE